MKLKLFTFFMLCCISFGYAQTRKSKKKSKVVVTGTMGVSYENYGLTKNPTGWTGFSPRKPWNQVRFTLKPTITIGDLKMPFNFSFATLPTNFLGPYAGIGALGNQTFSQFLSNPLNNFSINPKYKWAELQLGTQYLNYSDLTTGDVGIFGAGIDLRPGGYLIKFFTGTSQQGINQSFSPVVVGAYKRTHWMAQLGKEKEDVYKFAITTASGKDHFGSVTSPPLFVSPQKGFVLSLLGKYKLDNGYYMEAETAQNFFSTNILSGPPLPGGVHSFNPFYTADASSLSDFAGTAAFGKKSKNFDIGFKTNYLGAGYYTMGYPYQQSDKLDLTVNTRFNIWKNSDKTFKTNVVASIGQRMNNYSNSILKQNMLIANLNCFTQFNNNWSLNVNYNNFGFQSTGVNPYSIRNISNDFGVNPTYSWSTTKMANLLSLSYNYSQYDDRDVFSGITTSNLTHTVFVTYVPTYFNKSITPDFSLLYFTNQLPTFKTTLVTASAGIGTPLFDKKINLKGQLQYTFIKNNVFTPNNNVVANCTIDWKITKELIWTNYFSTNFYKYGNESIPFDASYVETNYRTGLLYKFSTKKQ
ncbi:hypothetical protein [Flavobacterium muglaense]|uniref:Outer membrane protein beta-barrel domain-containing protein n=1 Tax=Flavobacterium muglaense TaxID=2764716 RepID=A0A923MYU4_9FLAO|nr:hypothetical protein [Flavobacterium muglaense]MBC5837541.1 hypothetical protein [Flavobacterium muglaense]MBC5844042.1 hypothetical protein [Flavobacterium muglaense]